MAVMVLSTLLLYIGLASANYDEEAQLFLDANEPQLRYHSERCSEARYNYAVDLTVANADIQNRVCGENEILLRSIAKKASERFKPEQLQDPKTERAMAYLFRARSTKTDAESTEEDKLANELVQNFSTATICDPQYAEEECSEGNTIPLSPNLEEIMRESRNETILRRAWERWHAATASLKKGFFHLVHRFSTQALKDGYESFSQRLLEAYEDDSPDFRAQLKQLFRELLPLYEDLHAYVRYRLSERYDTVKLDEPIPAHLVGNMWAQEWQNIFDLVQPYPTSTHDHVDISKAMQDQEWTPTTMFHVGERFYTSLGFDSLPDKFWNKSMLEKPLNRDVVCHATAYDIHYNDKRIKMCTRITDYDLFTIHHELGHIYYYLAYQDTPVYFHSGPNPGFHEAVGDTMALSVTTDYLKQLNLVDKSHRASEENKINDQMRTALEKIMFLPFGYTLDLWRWDVFDGKINETTANDALWDLRLRYQGLQPPRPRSAGAFDATSKYHVAAFVPYIRYFVARLLQFDFHQSLCQLTHTVDDITNCSIYGNSEAGEKLWDVLKVGDSVPWPEALEMLTGRRQMSAIPMLKYFEKLAKWVRSENERLGLCIGWGTDWDGAEGLRGPRC